MLRDGTALLLRRWGTSLLVPLSLCSNMALVRLPVAGPPNSALGVPAAQTQALGTASILAQAGPEPPSAEGPCTSADSKDWQEYLFQSLVEVPVKTVNGWSYCRVTCAIYTHLKDFDRLAEVILSGVCTQ